MSPEGLVEESHRHQIMTGFACGAVPKRLMLESSPVARPPVCFPASRGSGNRNLALIGIPRAHGHLMLPSSRSSHLCATGASAGEKPLIGDELDAAGARRGPLCAHPPPRARMLHLIGGRGLGDRQGPCPFLKSQLSPLLWVRVNNVVSPIWQFHMVKRCSPRLLPISPIFPQTKIPALVGLASWDGAFAAGHVLRR